MFTNYLNLFVFLKIKDHNQNENKIAKKQTLIPNEDESFEIIEKLNTVIDNFQGQFNKKTVVYKEEMNRNNVK